MNRTDADPIFLINFRREAYLRERARARRRVILLGVWVAYFGVIGVLVGLYGLNCVSLNRRVAQLERQSERLRRQQGSGADWHVPANELETVEQYVLNPRRWRDRLVRLGTILPPNARITSLAVNPQNLSNPAEQNRLVITGVIRALSAEDRVPAVMRIVSTLQHDSLFTAGYQNVKLASTRVGDDAGGAEFVIECR